MNTSLQKSNKIGFFLILICGILLHFTFNWSVQNKIVGLFSAVNESTWEHMKILFVPSFVYFLVEYKKLHSETEHLLTARTLGLLCGLAFIPVSFYTYSGIIGKSNVVVDIIIFIISVFITLYASSKFLNCDFKFTWQAALLILFILLGLFFFFTYFPPHIALFLDPVHFTYGI